MDDMTGIERCTSKSLARDMIRDEKLKEETKEEKKKKFFDSFMKILTFIVVMHGLTMVTMSYILAFLDKIQIAEGLSQTVVSEIIAPVTIYGITKTVENVSKYNTWVNAIFNKKEEDYIYDERSDI